MLCIHNDWIQDPSYITQLMLRCSSSLKGHLCSSRDTRDVLPVFSVLRVTFSDKNEIGLLFWILGDSSLCALKHKKFHKVIRQYSDKRNSLCLDISKSRIQLRRNNWYPSKAAYPNRSDVEVLIDVSVCSRLSVLERAHCRGECYHNEWRG